jgi:hypothetical protein
MFQIYLHKYLQKKIGWKKMQPVILTLSFPTLSFPRIRYLSLIDFTKNEVNLHGQDSFCFKAQETKLRLGDFFVCCTKKNLATLRRVF